MSFWELNHPDSNIAVIDESTGQTFTYGDLQKSINIVKGYFPSVKKTLGFIFCRNNIGALTGYVAALQEEQAVCLLNSDLQKLLQLELIETYKPDWLWANVGFEAPKEYTLSQEFLGYSFFVRNGTVKGGIFPELAVLLSTSGTTGSPKTVRLSYKNIQSNAVSIAEYLELSSKERPITTLPIHYSYGLSVINSHLLVGATLLLTDQGVTSRVFWDFLKQNKATSLAGVPYTYQMLHRLGFEKMVLSSLSSMTQAGGRLDVNLQRHFSENAVRKGIRFYVMYGQTEATARISYIPYNRLPEGIGSIGNPIPGGRLEIDEETNELIYYGPNVMLGYGESRSDLDKGDELCSRLNTGDLAQQGENGFFYITGRMKRFLKIFGLRVNLDDVERLIEQQCGIRCFCIGDDTKLVIIVTDESIVSRVKDIVIEIYHIHSSVIKVRYVEEIPHLPTGKVDYKALQEGVGI